MNTEWMLQMLQRPEMSIALDRRLLTTSKCPGYLGAFDQTDRDVWIPGLVIRDCSDTERPVIIDHHALNLIKIASKENYHFYMADTSRVSIYRGHKDHQRQGLSIDCQLITFLPWRAGKNEGNVGYVARSIAQCLEDVEG
ncbi:hypothetical protein N7523_002131 [Penicillium sp. IBT 18751x]|nr:hypothetical protein N7523_002131 [Penicillium sp. IBT 18751x]